MLHGPSLVLLWPNQMIFPAGPNHTSPGRPQGKLGVGRDSPNPGGPNSPLPASAHPAGPKSLTRLGRGPHPAGPSFTRLGCFPDPAGPFACTRVGHSWDRSVARGRVWSISRPGRAGTSFPGSLPGRIISSVRQRPDRSLVPCRVSNGSFASTPAESTLTGIAPRPSLRQQGQDPCTRHPGQDRPAPHARVTHVRHLQ